MNYTNLYGLPEVLVRAVIDDPYTKGDSDLSVTQLITPPRIVCLADLNASRISSDIVERIPSLMGRVLHSICEQYAPEGAITEERFFGVVEGMKISGAVDLQIPLADGTWALNDYKLTKVYSVLDEKPEWTAQLNAYAYLMRLNGKRVSKLQIVAILKDWSRRLSEVKPGYPAAQVVVVDIPVWSDAQQEAYVRERVILHQQARGAIDTGAKIPACTEEERWSRDEAWALMKEGRKAAVKLYDNPNDALEAARAKGDGFYVEHRPGDPVRCRGNYCQVSQWCRVWREDPRSGLADGAG